MIPGQGSNSERQGNLACPVQSMKSHRIRRDSAAEQRQGTKIPHARHTTSEKEKKLRTLIAFGKGGRKMGLWRIQGL